MVTVVLFLDFFLTGMIIGNYEFVHQVEGHDANYMDNLDLYVIIGLVQGFDIILNFFKMPKIEGKEINDPF